MRSVSGKPCHAQGALLQKPANAADGEEWAGFTPWLCLVRFPLCYWFLLATPALTISFRSASCTSSCISPGVSVISNS